MIFKWDEDKANINREKHGVGFEEARTIWWDPFTLTRGDPRHPGEDRFVDVGMSASARLLVVVYTERGPRTRLISARLATPSERRAYEEEP